MADSTNHAQIPKAALLGAGLILASTIGLVLVHQHTGFLGQPLAVAPAHTDASAGVLASRMIRVADRSDGAVVVIDDHSGATIDVVTTGKDGFIRGVFRGLARERSLHGIGEAPAFRLTRYDDGRLFLEDPATGSLVSINAFGATNIQTFARILMHDTGETS